VASGEQAACDEQVGSCGAVVASRAWAASAPAVAEGATEPGHTPAGGGYADMDEVAEGAEDVEDVEGAESVEGAGDAGGVGDAESAEGVEGVGSGTDAAEAEPAAVGKAARNAARNAAPNYTGCGYKAESRQAKGASTAGTELGSRGAADQDAVVVHKAVVVVVVVVVVVSALSPEQACPHSGLIRGTFPWGV